MNAVPDITLHPALLSTSLWAGLVGFTLGLSFLLWTRWGRYHLLGKCVFLSLLAHLLFGVYFQTRDLVVTIQSAQAEQEPPSPAPILEQVETVVADLDPENSMTVDELEQGGTRPGFGDRVTDAVAMQSHSVAKRPEAEAPPDQPETAEMEPLPHELPVTQPSFESELSQRPELTLSMPESPGVTDVLPAPESTGPRAEAVTSVDLPAARITVGPAAGRRQDDEPRGGAPFGGDEIELGNPDLPPGDDGLAATRPAAPRIVSAIPSSGTAGPVTGIDLAPTAGPDSLNLPRGEEGAPANTSATTRNNRNGTAGPSTGFGTRFAPKFGATRGGGGAESPGLGRGPGDGPPLPEPRLPTGNDTLRPVRPDPTTVSLRSGRTGSATGGKESGLIRRPDIYRSRNNPDRSQRAIGQGASKESEQAVELALKWLATHQGRDGGWDTDGFDANCPPGSPCLGRGNQNLDDSATTGLVLLAFLGAGHTHQTGDYTREVAAAINWLLRRQQSDGDLRGSGRMYSHGIAALALSEAYGMTGDPVLQGPVRRAASFIVAAQHPTSGGWRYQPGQYGDTSIFGWQLMALKSASLAGVEIPDATWQRARRWLSLVASGSAGGLASYLPGERPTPAMTAEAQVCRIFLGANPDAAPVVEAANYLANYLPRWERRNLYYWYYGTLASFQVGGESWANWNQAIRDPLVANQQREGHEAGSWRPQGDPWAQEGGRVYATAMATLCLEIYYRYLPLQTLTQETPSQ